MFSYGELGDICEYQKYPLHYQWLKMFINQQRLPICRSWNVSWGCTGTMRTSV